MDTVPDKIAELEKLIGKTPLIEIDFNYKHKECKIYSKLEYYNYTGSIKDRMALYILKKAYNKAHIKNNYTIIEATSGNAGISFSAIGTYLGNKVEIYTPDWISEESKLILKSFGAKLHLISQSDGGFLECIVQIIERANTNNNIFLPSQFSNEDNISAHYLSTGPEILNILLKNNISPSAFVAGVGTGGTLMGVGKYLNEYNNSIKLYPIEPLNSPILSAKKEFCKHRIQGIADEFIPPLLKLDKLHKIISIDDGDAIIMAQMLASKLGLGVGISSGANFLGCVKALDILGSDAEIATIFPDDNRKYLRSYLEKTEPPQNNFLSPSIELIGIKTLI
ncbi:MULTISPECIES: cysteine synthase family protein [Clostridium]|uniref:Cysteine synthase family protein n=1 Tax=Clostridium cibarium TaxID=2762247 RepID=A0ABR8PRA5_9CLOT|nr:MULTISPECIES: cysteine synthase family protein [Clostridium]MBD7910711.1 cysteine synthase family protein [Clostridium cibarium]